MGFNSGFKGLIVTDRLIVKSLILKCIYIVHKTLFPPLQKTQPASIRTIQAVYV